MVSMQTSPRCQISSAPVAISLTVSGKRSCVSARTKIRNGSFNFSDVVMEGKVALHTVTLHVFPPHVSMHELIFAIANAKCTLTHCTDTELQNSLKLPTTGTVDTRDPC